MESRRLDELSRLFAQHNIYPQQALTERTAIRVFQKEFPEDPYSTRVEQLIQQQPVKTDKRGADLPWWGKDYFMDTPGHRTMVISQDSLSPDAGSIVFYACFMPTHTSAQVGDWVNRNGLGRFRSWEKARKLLNSLVPWDFTYITDAAKVYMEGSWRDGDFDRKKSRELLRAEIDVCNPDLVIVLGRNALELLQFEEVYSQVVGQRVLQKKGRHFIVAPFPSNANVNGYEQRALNTVQLVRKWVEGAIL